MTDTKRCCSFCCCRCTNHIYRINNAKWCDLVTVCCTVCQSRVNVLNRWFSFDTCKELIRCTIITINIITGCTWNCLPCQTYTLITAFYGKCRCSRCCCCSDFCTERTAVCIFKRVCTYFITICCSSFQINICISSLRYCCNKCICSGRSSRPGLR